MRHERASTKFHITYSLFESGFYVVTSLRMSIATHAGVFQPTKQRYFRGVTERRSMRGRRTVDSVAPCQMDIVERARLSVQKGSSAPLSAALRPLPPGT